MAQNAKIAAMLELIDDLVNSDADTPWKVKAENVRSLAKANGHEVALLEFIGWFPEDESF